MMITIRQEPEVALAQAEARIAWVMARPHGSDWLKQALATARGRDPVALGNDVEMLRHLLIPRIQAEIDLAMAPVRALAAHPPSP